MNLFLFKHYNNRTLGEEWGRNNPFEGKSYLIDLWFDDTKKKYSYKCTKTPSSMTIANGSRINNIKINKEGYWTLKLLNSEKKEKPIFINESSLDINNIIDILCRIINYCFTNKKGSTSFWSSSKPLKLPRGCKLIQAEDLQPSGELRPFVVLPKDKEQFDVADYVNMLGIRTQNPIQGQPKIFHLNNDYNSWYESSSVEEGNKPGFIPRIIKIGDDPVVNQIQAFVNQIQIIKNETKPKTRVFIYDEKPKEKRIVFYLEIQIKVYVTIIIKINDAFKDEYNDFIEKQKKENFYKISMIDIVKGFYYPNKGTITECNTIINSLICYGIITLEKKNETETECKEGRFSQNNSYNIYESYNATLEYYWKRMWEYKNSDKYDDLEPMSDPPFFGKKEVEACFALVYLEKNNIKKIRGGLGLGLWNTVKSKIQESIYENPIGDFSDYYFIIIIILENDENKYDFRKGIYKIEERNKINYVPKFYETVVSPQYMSFDKPVYINLN
jgi:hypothetical protein